MLTSMSNLVRVPSGDVVLALHDLGGHGDVLLIAHANGFSGMCYQALAARLGQCFHCYALDMRGQGDGPPCLGQHFEQYAADLVTTVDYLQARGCHIFGHSGGGLAAIMAQEKHPGLFSSMYLYEPPLFDPEEDTRPGRKGISFTEGLRIMSLSARRRRSRFDSREAAYAAFVSKPPLSRFSPDVLHAYVTEGFRDLPDGSVELKCSPEVEFEVYHAVVPVARAAVDGLSRITCPVTVACGKDFADSGFVERESPRISARIPSARLEIYDGLQHLGPFEDPAFVADRVLSHFRAACDPSLWARLPRVQTLTRSLL